MKRRQFVKGLLTATASAGMLTDNPISLSFRKAMAAEGKSVVVIFQRGGCDGLNVVVPYSEPNYYNIRPTIAIPAPDSGLANAALDLNGVFGLDNNMTGLHQIWQEGNLAIMPTTHYNDASRSHFDSQHYIESARPGVRNGQQASDDGWLNRHMQSQFLPSSFRAVSMGRGGIAQSLVGSADAKTIGSLADFSIGVADDEQAMLLQRIDQIYQQPASAMTNHQLLQRFGSSLVSDLNIIGDIRNQEYIPDNGVTYPNSGLARDLQQVAQLLKAGVGLEIATVSVGGWDTHADQAMLLPPNLGRFSEAITAFYQDMGSMMSDVVILTATEFGRTSHENGSHGTDHGHASCWFAMGGGISGGIYGDWPGLEDDQLNRGRYLEHTLDCHDIYGDILVNHMLNNDLATVLPGHSYSPVGLF
ncbi:DUF1501 domain-containing protein [Planctobacterium marinum]|uniref:DUF1501 domain-containing protein n=1 Tax=Planctobacterium marinum TaxID=1631968 RepID=A0AA48KSI9_9ALTE|nr:hypothetical protein MACH26_27080 [Planctobacterium marinum]